MSYIAKVYVNGHGPYYREQESYREDGKVKTRFIRYIGKNPEPKTSEIETPRTEPTNQTPKQTVDLTGEADRKGLTRDGVDQKEYKMGMEVEKEHSKDPKVREQIVLDHLTEDPKYYTHLAEMEEKYAENS